MFDSPVVWENARWMPAWRGEGQASPIQSQALVSAELASGSLSYAQAFFTVSETSPGWFEAKGSPKDRKIAGLSAPTARALAKCNAFEY